MLISKVSQTNIQPLTSGGPKAATDPSPARVGTALAQAGTASSVGTGQGQGEKETARELLRFNVDDRSH